MSQECISKIFDEEDEMSTKMRTSMHNIKKLLSFSGDDSKLIEIQNEFLQWIQTSSNGIYYFIHLLNHYAKIRPMFPQLPTTLAQAIISTNPQQQEEICLFIMKRTKTLQNVMLLKNSSDLQQKLFTILKNDDVDSMISFMSENPNFDLDQEHDIFSNHYYLYLFDMEMKITFIDLCSLFGSLECFKYLLLNNCTISQNTLKWSIAGGNQEIVSILKEKGYPFQECLETSVVYHRYDLTDWILNNFKCNQPVSLISCIESFNFAAFLYFMRLPNPISEVDGHSCLYAASTIGHLQLVVLLEDINQSLNSQDILHPLFTALAEHHIPVADFLIQRGVDINICDKYQRSPIHIATIDGMISIIQYLIKHGANPEVRDRDRKTPLHYACEEGYLDIVKYLISLQVNIEAEDSFHRRPLHYACFRGHLPVVKYLIENASADFDAGFYSNNTTPILLAAQSGKVDVVKYLLSQGAQKPSLHYDGSLKYDGKRYPEIKELLNPDSNCLIG